MVHRPFIRKAINYVFYHFVFETERHNGIAGTVSFILFGRAPWCIFPGEAGSASGEGWSHGIGGAKARAHCALDLSRRGVVCVYGRIALSPVIVGAHWLVDPRRIGQPRNTSTIPSPSQTHSQSFWRFWARSSTGLLSRSRTSTRTFSYGPCSRCTSPSASRSTTSSCRTASRRHVAGFFGA